MKRASHALSFALGALLAGCGEDAKTAAITVTRIDGPAAGIDVVFHDADGQPTDHLTTGSDGRASAEVSEGGMVTVLLAEADDGPTYRATLVGVEPGDELTFVVPPRANQIVGQAYVTVDSYPGAMMYILEDACSSIYTSDVSQPVPIEVRTNCVSADGTFHLLVTTYDEQMNSLARAYLRDLTFTDPMNVTMPEWAPMEAFGFVGSNASPDALGVSLQVTYDVNGVFFGGPSVGSLTPGGGITLAVEYAPSFADYLQPQIGVIFGENLDSLDGASMLIERYAVPPASRTLDLTADLLPRVSAPVYDQTDPARPAMSWTTQGSLSGTDGGALLFAWREVEGPREEWAVLIPPGTSSPVQLPALPAELASWAPNAAVEYEQGTVWFVDAEWVSSYRELRTGVALDFVFGEAHDVFPDTDTAVQVTMGGEL